MGLVLDDAEVGELASRLAELQQTSQTEAVRTALKRELEGARARQARATDLHARIAAIQKEARRMAGPNPQAVTKAWIDGLYEGE